MNLSELKEELKNRYVHLQQVTTVKDLQKTQDSYIEDGGELIGINLKNVDLEDLFKELFAIKTVKHLFLENVNFQEDTFHGVNLEHLKSLGLPYFNLDELPKEIYKITSLQSLDLSYNSLLEIPKEIFNLTSLQSLDLRNNYLEKVPKEIFNLISLQSLDLSSNSLQEIPKEIFNLTSLQNLNLSQNSLQEIPKEIFNLTSLQNLNLSRNSFQEIPKEIHNLTSLQSLNLRATGLQEIPREIFNLTSLQSLDLSLTILQKIPKEIFNLTSLQSLNLSDNSLKEIPKEIFNLTNLQSLYLRSNYLEEIPKEILKLTSLQSLVLRHNQLEEIPKEILKLTSLQSLDLRDNYLEDLPKEFSNLTSLQSLYLSSNSFQDLPQEIFNLTSLQSLDLSYNSFQDLPQEIFNLTSLQSLDLSSNSLQEIPKEIFNLTSLQSLDLRNNYLKKVPKEIFNLISLQSLDLSSNSLQEIPKEIFNLTSLQNLNLSQNSLQEIPKEIFNLKRLTYFELSDLRNEYNPIKTIPDEIAELKVLNSFLINENYLNDFYKTAYNGGLENLKNALKQRKKQGREKLYEAKLLFVGEPKAGKTSLMEKILDRDFPLKDPQESDSTLGIDIKTHKFPFPKDNSITFKANMWDFGGQQIQYMTHQFFLTPKSLYVLVADDRKDRSSFDYWFHIINLLSESSPILVVLNQINHKRSIKISLDSYKERYSEHFIDSEQIDLADIDDRYGYVKSKVENMLASLPHVATELPSHWVDIRQRLSEIERPYISYEEFKGICGHFYLSEEDIKTLSRSFTHLGFCLHFVDDEHGLADTMFLNPEWLTKGIYAMLDGEYLESNCGRFTKQWLFKLWDKLGFNYSDKIKNSLLTLMKKDKFEICYKLENEKDTYIAPQLLPSELDGGYSWNYQGNLFFRFQYPFMPKGIISRLIVRMNDRIYREENKEFVWEQGVILKEGDAKALVLETESSDGVKIIDIAIDGNRYESQELLRDIKKEVKIIHKSFPKIEFEEMIPCCCKECIVDKNSNYYKFSDLKNLIDKEIYQAQCFKSGFFVSITDLLGQIVDKRRVERDGNNYRDSGKNIHNGDVIYQTYQNSFNKTTSIEITFNQHINGLTGGLSSLKKKIDDEELKVEIEEIEKELQELPKVLSKDEAQSNSTLSDLKDLMTELGDRVERGDKLLASATRAGKKLQSLGRTYNDFASNFGLPVVPAFLLGKS